MRQISIIAPLLALLTLTGCGSSDDTTQLEFKHAKTDKSAKLTKDEDSPRCQVHLDMAYVAEQHGETAKTINECVTERVLNLTGLSMQQATDSFASKYARDYVKNFAPLYREDRADKQKHAWYEYRYSVDTDPHPGRKGCTVYNIMLDYYEGGAHGIKQRLVMNFDNLTGQRLQLSDIFVPGYEAKLNEQLLKALMDLTDTHSLDELHDKGYLYSMDMFAPENFVLDRETMTFVYNPYEIASYDEGIIELTFDYDDLEDLLKKD